MDEATLEILQAGGVVAMILLIMSVVAVSIIVTKLIQFRIARIAERRDAEQALALWQRGRSDDALTRAAADAGPVAQSLARAFRGYLRGLDEGHVREEVVRYGSEVLERLRGGFRALELIGSLAPLLGLFGTVLGMIEAFQQLENAGNQVNPAVLSSGIWQALLTTAIGLAVAIPVVALLGWLERRIERLAHAMDDTVTRVFTPDLAEGTSDDGGQKPRAASGE
ncbi:MotA/TolQ/ExbB proton channel family protein [Spiribacter vilamensis]|uniref:Biopolymer transport protein ExbB/TolQ n=1 Tax=Spiribacter vilamensis TaxID=531306 RepID=A0A4Q8D096_9GAMM|nr:MotA/TolQ/ExbB proton channel family protein [Spiribacter vilamensis]RZU98703.1 biopolymer transport protein ExbB/TolQ [Spiribacter vilamensis]TVO62271.1 MotA/TolQ/ExbB proton channel family protein [Spiribacter vilamensis]